MRVRLSGRAAATSGCHCKWPAKPVRPPFQLWLCWQICHTVILCARVWAATVEAMEAGSLLCRLARTQQRRCEGSGDEHWHSCATSGCPAAQVHVSSSAAPSSASIGGHVIGHQNPASAWHAKCACSRMRTFCCGWFHTITHLSFSPSRLLHVGHLRRSDAAAAAPPASAPSAALPFALLLPSAAPSADSCSGVCRPVLIWQAEDLHIPLLRTATGHAGMCRCVAMTHKNPWIATRTLWFSKCAGERPELCVCYLRRREEHGLQQLVQSVDDFRHRNAQRGRHCLLEGAPKVRKHALPLRLPICKHNETKCEHDTVRAVLLSPECPRRVARGCQKADSTPRSTCPSANGVTS